MAYFNPISEYITVRFTCPECGKEVVSDAMGVPSPNFAAENNSDSRPIHMGIAFFFNYDQGGCGEQNRSME